MIAVICALTMLVGTVVFVISPDDFGRLVVSLVGVAAGAGLAYELQNRREREKLIDERSAAGNLAVFSLSRSLNSLVQYQKQFIAPVRESPARMIELLPSIVDPIIVPTFDFAAHMKSKQLSARAYLHP